MNDPEIRAVFKDNVLRGGHPESLIVDELGLLFGDCRSVQTGAN